MSLIIFNVALGVSLIEFCFFVFFVFFLLKDESINSSHNKQKYVKGKKKGIHFVHNVLAVSFFTEGLSSNLLTVTLFLSL